MQFSRLCLLSLTALAVAQNNTQDLVALLGATSELSQLTELITGVDGLAATLAGLQGITVFAPSNDALGALETVPQGDNLVTLLQYHVAQGVVESSALTSTPTFAKTLLNNTDYAQVTSGQVIEAVSADGTVTLYTGFESSSDVTTADLRYNNGIVHIIDTVLTIPAPISDTANAADLELLTSYLITANLVDTLEGLTDVTILAPSDAAFEAIGSAVGELTPEQVTSILQYHVINGTVGYSTNLTDGQTIPTLDGGDVTVNVEGSNIFINGAAVVVPNVLVANGVVHIIDNVLNPESASAAPSESATAGSPQFSGAASSDLPSPTNLPPQTTSVESPPTGVNPLPSTAETSSATSGAAHAPMRTGAASVAALFGGAAAVMMA